MEERDELLDKNIESDVEAHKQASEDEDFELHKRSTAMTDEGTEDDVEGHRNLVEKSSME